MGFVTTRLGKILYLFSGSCLLYLLVNEKSILFKQIEEKRKIFWLWLDS